eukprot:SM000138S00021  [mRNA]  locus=s138:25122:26724:- [translate_table: standard]
MATAATLKFVSTMTSTAVGSAEPSAIVAFVSVPNKETGQMLAKGLVERKLAACVNRIPGVESVYWWEGKLEMDQEELLIVKTQHALLHDVTDFVKAHHPYDLSETIGVSVVGGSSKYIQWIADSTQRG